MTFYRCSETSEDLVQVDYEIAKMAIQFSGDLKILAERVLRGNAARKREVEAALDWIDFNHYYCKDSEYFRLFYVIKTHLESL